MKIGFEILENEVWWGGSAELALAQPYGKDTSLTIALENTENQTTPLFLSSQGRYVWGGPLKYFRISLKKKNKFALKRYENEKE